MADMTVPPSADLIEWLLTDLRSRRDAMWDTTRTPATEEERMAFVRAGEIDTIISFIPLLAAQVQRLAVPPSAPAMPNVITFIDQRLSEGLPDLSPVNSWVADLRAIKALMLAAAVARSAPGAEK